MAPPSERRPCSEHPALDPLQSRRCLLRAPATQACRTSSIGRLSEQAAHYKYMCQRLSSFPDLRMSVAQPSSRFRVPVHRQIACLSALPCAACLPSCFEASTSAATTLGGLGTVCAVRLHARAICMGEGLPCRSCRALLELQCSVWGSLCNARCPLWPEISID